MPRPFLTARWQHLAVVTYPIVPEALRGFLPRGLEFDTWNGQALVSLVAFDFRRTRVFGVPWPGLTDFPEVNLRFYVREASGGRRGVCFVRELVPSRVVSWVARVWYNEPYEAMRMHSSVSLGPGRVDVAHAFGREGRGGEVRIIGLGEPAIPGPGSLDHFLKEHEWGFGRDARGRTLAYRVEHPVWRAWRVEQSHVRVDFGPLYGEQFRSLADTPPLSILLAEGSAVTVFAPERE